MSFTPNGLSAKFWAIVGATFLGFLGIGTVLPGLGPHIRHDLGGTDQTVGFVIGIFSLVALGSRFFSGPFTDRRGRKAAFQIGLVSCALAGVAYLLPIGIPGAYFGRILQGFGEACLYTGAAAWGVEAAGVHRSSQALGYVSSGIWGGLSAGPAIGQWLGSFERAAMLQTFLALAAFALLTQIKEDYRPVPHGKKRVWIPRSIIAPGVGVGFVNVHYPAITGFLILSITAKYGTANKTGSLAFTAYACMVLFSRFFLGGLPDKISPKITYYGGLAIMAAGLLGIAAGPPPLFAILSAATLGFGFSFPWSSVAGTVLRNTPENERGSAVGVLSAFYDLFVGFSSFAAGQVAHSFGYPAVFVMGAVALIAAAICGRHIFSVKPEPVAEPEMAISPALSK